MDLVQDSHRSPFCSKLLDETHTLLPRPVGRGRRHRLPRTAARAERRPIGDLRTASRTEHGASSDTRRNAAAAVASCRNGSIGTRATVAQRGRRRASAACRSPASAHRRASTRLPCSGPACARNRRESPQPLPKTRPHMQPRPLGLRCIWGRRSHAEPRIDSARRWRGYAAGAWARRMSTAAAWARVRSPVGSRRPVSV